MHNQRMFSLAAIAGILGATVLLTGIALSIAFYRGPSREPYSLLNHFISELGWARHTHMAWAFNGSLIVGAVLLAPLVYALGRSVGTRLGRAGAGTGLFTLLAGAAVGLVPMDHLRPHLAVALIFFLGWLAMACAFTMAFWLDGAGRFPHHLVVAGALSVVLCAVFLALPKGRVLTAFEHPETLQRPRVWLLAVAEWAVFGSMVAWMMLAARWLWERRRADV